MCHPHQLCARRRRFRGVASAPTAMRRPARRPTGRPSRSCAWRPTRSSRATGPCRTAAGPGDRRSRRRIITPTGTSARRRSARAARRLCGDSRRRATCSAGAAGDYLLASPSRRRAACAGPTGPIRTDALRRRTSRASTTAPPGSATTSGRCSRHARAAVPRPPHSPACAGWSLAPRALRAPTACSWRWTDDPSWRVAYTASAWARPGIVLALDAFADRTGDPTFRAYARAGAARLRYVTANGARPLPRGSDGRDARDRFPLRLGRSGLMFLERYGATAIPPTSRRRAGCSLGERQSVVDDSAGGVRWPLADTTRLDASGFELGVAGIAWVNLQAARLDRRRRYLERRAPGRRLAAARRLRRAGEMPGDPPPGPRRARQRRRRARLGAPRSRPRRHRPKSEPRGRPVGARRIRAEARRDRLGALWYENRTGGRPRLPRGAVVALGRRRDRRVRRPARRLVRPAPAGCPGG